MTLPSETAAPQLHVVQVNGVTMHCDVRGSGPPLILLHAGTLNADSWQPFLAAFTERYRVFTPDSRGHGRTDNPSGAMSYRLLADDIAALAQALDLHKPLIAGYSDGGQIALELGMRYPELPRCLIVGGATFKFSQACFAWVSSVLGDSKNPNVDFAHFERHQPDWAALLQRIHGPDRWKVLLAQIKPMWTTPLNYTPADFARVSAPTLVMQGDRDEMVPVEEAAEMCRLLPNAELGVVPGADHGAFFSARAAIYQALMLEYLDRNCS
jgi:pimeloyl-ACP methyl ester carboxylesterase